MIDWHALFVTFWGHGENLPALAMAVRALSMFFLVLLQIRLAGARSFGLKSSFDNVVVIMLGAIAARGVVGASPFGSTVAACAVIVLVHRILARLCVTREWLAKLLQGERVPLYVGGRLQCDNLKITSVSEQDLLEAHRLETRTRALSPREEAFLERSGRISFVDSEQTQ